LLAPESSSGEAYGSDDYDEDPGAEDMETAENDADAMRSLPLAERLALMASGADGGKRATSKLSSSSIGGGKSYGCHGSKAS